MLKAIIPLTSTIRICLLLALCLAGTSMAAESTPATEVKLKPALLQYLYDQVLVADSQAAVESLQKLQEQLASLIGHYCKPATGIWRCTGKQLKPCI